MYLTAFEVLSGSFSLVFTLLALRTEETRNRWAR